MATNFNLNNDDAINFILIVFKDIFLNENFEYSLQMAPPRKVNLSHISTFKDLSSYLCFFISFLTETRNNRPIDHSMDTIEDAIEPTSSDDRYFHDLKNNIASGILAAKNQAIINEIRAPAHDENSDLPKAHNNGLINRAFILKLICYFSMNSDNNFREYKVKPISIDIILKTIFSNLGLNSDDFMDTLKFNQFDALFDFIHEKIISYKKTNFSSPIKQTLIELKGHIIEGHEIIYRSAVSIGACKIAYSSKETTFKAINKHLNAQKNILESIASIYYIGTKIFFEYEDDIRQELNIKIDTIKPRNTNIKDKSQFFEIFSEKYFEITIFDNRVSLKKSRDGVEPQLFDLLELTLRIIHNLGGKRSSYKLMRYFEHYQSLNMIEIIYKYIKKYADKFLFFFRETILSLPFSKNLSFYNELKSLGNPADITIQSIEDSELLNEISQSLNDLWKQIALEEKKIKATKIDFNRNLLYYSKHSYEFMKEVDVFEAKKAYEAVAPPPQLATRVTTPIKVIKRDDELLDTAAILQILNQKQQEGKDFDLAIKSLFSHIGLSNEPKNLSTLNGVLVTSQLGVIKKTSRWWITKNDAPQRCRETMALLQWYIGFKILSIFYGKLQQNITTAVDEYNSFIILNKFILIEHYGNFSVKVDDKLNTFNIAYRENNKNECGNSLAIIKQELGGYVQAKFGLVF